MEKLGAFLVLLLLLDVALIRSADEDWSEKFEVVAKLAGLEVEDGLITGDEVFEVLRSDHGNKVVVNVDAFGAVGDGVADDTQAFVDAWKQACSTSNSVLLVPQVKVYLVSATRFKGPCAGKITVQIDGTIIAPDNPKNWDPKNPRVWLGFYNISKADFHGRGTIDGSGAQWWAASCKKNKTNPCVGAPTAFTIDSSSAIRVKDLTIQNGQQMNFIIARSNSVRVMGVKVSAPGDSPNTDGIHITASTNVVLQNCKIGTGDDCISIVNGSSNIKMKNIDCGPGHGISIGSLGQGNSIGIVEKVVLDNARIHDTTNGLRIKTYQGGSGYVRAIRYQNVIMDNVQNPIIIDQFYCDTQKPCQNQTSAVEISGIMYREISGTSNSKHVMSFSCSDTVPCTKIVLNNVNIRSTNGSTVDAYCNSVSGFTYGNVQPSAECLSSSDKDMVISQETEGGDTQTSYSYVEEHIIHTEL